MSRSEAEPCASQVATIGPDLRPALKPIAPIERAFRRIVEYRSQPNFEHVPDRVAA